MKNFLHTQELLCWNCAVVCRKIENTLQINANEESDSVFYRIIFVFVITYVNDSKMLAERQNCIY